MIAICGCNLIASPIDDLASPSQETRDAAAKILRTTYVPPSKTNWDALLSQLKVGDNMTNVEKLLHEYNAEPSSEIGNKTGKTGYSGYRLDDLWMLKCDFESDESSNERNLIKYEFYATLRRIWVAPPLNFTGEWSVYFVNGQMCNEINYKDGQYFGEFIAFNPDGSKMCLQHYISGTLVDDLEFNKDGTTNYFKDYTNQ